MTTPPSASGGYPTHRWASIHVTSAVGRAFQPYRGGDVSMRIILPTRIDGLSELEAGVTSQRLEEWHTPRVRGSAR